MKGVALMFESRVPTVAELETCDLLIMTSETCWDPHSPKFQEDGSAAAYARQFRYLESEHHFRRLQSVYTGDCLNVLSQKTIPSFLPGWMAQIPGTFSTLRLKLDI